MSGRLLIWRSLTVQHEIITIAAEWTTSPKGEFVRIAADVEFDPPAEKRE